MNWHMNRINEAVKDFQWLLILQVEKGKKKNKSKQTKSSPKEESLAFKKPVFTFIGKQQ